MAVTIRFATSHDAETILEFVRGLAEYEREPDAVQATAVELRAQMEGDDPPFECLLAENNSEPVGFALFFRNFSTWSGRPGLYLEDIFVREEFRARGVGDALMRRLAEVARARGWARMEWSVLNWNVAAQKFYRARGASPMEQWTTWRLETTGLEALAEKKRR